MAGTLCSFNKPLSRSKQRTSCLKRLPSPQPLQSRSPRTAKRGLKPAGHGGFVDDLAGGRDLSAGPEGAEVGPWAVPWQNTRGGLVQFIETFTGINQLD